MDLGLNLSLNRMVGRRNLPPGSLLAAAINAAFGNNEEGALYERESGTSPATLDDLSGNDITATWNGSAYEATFPDLGSNVTIAYDSDEASVTLTGEAISGSTTFPSDAWSGIMYLNRYVTPSEQKTLDNWLASNTTEVPFHKNSHVVAARARMAAANSGSTVNYVVAGDSTRDNSYNNMEAYYTHQLAKIGVDVDYNAESGQSGQNWKDNTGTATLNQALSLTPNTGTGTIFEYSFGINDDKDGATRAEVKGWLKDGIEAYIAARPDAAVILVVPVHTANSTRNDNLQGIYREIAAELDLPLIDVLQPTGLVHGDTDYYEDSTHPNANGSFRVVNYILNRLSPESLHSSITLDDEYLTTAPPTSSDIAEPVESGYWSTANGEPQPNTDWRRMQAITVSENSTVEVTHQGNRTDAILMDSEGNFISTASKTVSGDTITYEIPIGAVELRVNISSDGATYDSLGDTPTAFYGDPPYPPLTQAQVNSGLNIWLPEAA